jgi:glutathione S-transferase
LEELSLPFKLEFVEPDNESSHTTTSGGGAPPVQDKNTGMIILTDPNTDVTLWESLAVIEYLTKTYDHQNSLSYGNQSPECWHVQQWLAYQMGAQSPFFSLKAWFSNQHEEKVPSVIQRFADDVNRVVGIVDHYLKQGGTGYLVGNKCTYADLVFVPWNNKLSKSTFRRQHFYVTALLTVYEQVRSWVMRKRQRYWKQHRILRNGQTCFCLGRLSKK